MAAQNPISVRGLADLQRAFRFAEHEIHKDLRMALESSADPVRAAAEQLAVSRISRIGIPWSRMRVGVTRSSVYVAPVERGVKSRTLTSRRRPNLKPLLLDRALDPALELNRNKVIGEVEDTLNDLARAWSRI